MRGVLPEVRFLALPPIFCERDKLLSATASEVNAVVNRAFLTGGLGGTAGLFTAANPVSAKVEASYTRRGLLSTIWVVE